MLEANVVSAFDYGAQFAGWYDRMFPGGPVATRYAEFLARVHPGFSEGTLELGVGTGRVAKPLSRITGSVVGLDSSDDMIEILSKDVNGSLVEPVRGDMRTFRTPRSFGLIYSVCSSLSLVLDKGGQQAVFENVASMLCPGGVFIIEVHNRDGCFALHEGQTRASFFFPYPEPNTGLQTHATLLDDGLWHCSQIWFESDGSHRIGQETIRLLTPEQVDSYAEAAGLVRDSLWGNELGEEFEQVGVIFSAAYRLNR